VWKEKSAQTRGEFVRIPILSFVPDLSKITKAER
jgi:hypothetical protein